MAYPSGPAIFAPHSELRGPSKVNHATSGCLTCVRPDGTVTVLRRDLAFANGVVLAPHESFLLVAETIGYRILKFWLKGPRAGQWVEFVTGTPGFPDNISLSESGLVWVSLPAPRVPALDSCSPGTPILRQLAHRVPQRLQPEAEDIVRVQAYDLDGTLVHDRDSLSSPRLPRVAARSGSRARTTTCSAGSTCPNTERDFRYAEGPKFRSCEIGNSFRFS